MQPQLQYLRIHILQQYARKKLTEKLIKKRTNPKDNPVYYVKRAHIAKDHDVRDRMVKETSKKYANITQYSLDIFKSSSTLR